MPRRTKQEAEKTRQSLIQTALMVFSDKGVAKTTLTDIASAAGVTKGAFYWHFENKHQIFKAIFDTYVETVDNQAEDILRNEPNPVEAIRKSACFYLDALEQDTNLQAVYSLYFFKCEYTKEFAPILQREQREMKEAQELIYLALQRLPESLCPSEPLCQQLSNMIVDYMTGVIFRWVRDKEGGLTEQAMIGIDLLLKGAGVRVDSGIK